VTGRPAGARRLIALLMARTGISRLADQMGTIIYVWAALEAGGALWAGIVGAAAFATAAFGAAFGGPLVGRLGGPPIFLAAGIANALGAALLAWLLLTGTAAPWMIAALVGASALLDMPAIVAAENRRPPLARLARLRLFRVNAWDDLLEQGATVAGPALGGVALLALGAGHAALVVAMLAGAAFLATLATLRAVRAPKRVPPPVWSALRAAAGVLRRDGATAWALALAAAGLSLFLAIEIVVLPAAVRAAGGGPKEATLFLATLGLGAILGGASLALLGARVERMPMGWLFAVGLTGLAAGTVAVALAPLDQAALAGGGLLAGLAVAPLSPLVATLVQTRPPRALRADALGMSQAAMLAGAPLAAVVLGLAAEIAAPRDLLLSIAALFGALALAALAARPLAAPLGPVPTTNTAETRAINASPVANAGGSARPSLARASLLLEWRRYLAAVVAVAFSGLLVLVQVALLLGLFGTVTTIIDRGSTDLWVVDAETRSFDLAREMPRRVETLVRAHPEVARVEPVVLGMGDWRTPEGGRVSVTIAGFDTRTDGLAFPADLAPALRQALQAPGTVLADAVDLGKLGLPGGTGNAEVNDQRVALAGVVEGFRSIGGATLLTSRATAQTLLGTQDAERVTYLVLGLTPGADPARVAAELEARIPGVRVMPPAELSALSQTYWLMESGTGVGFLFSTLLGLAVGVAITSQTLRAAVLGSLREYATLRALGVPLASLRAVLLEQSFWIGLAGLAVTAVTAALLLSAAAAVVAVAVPWWAAAGTAAFTLLVALGSGLLALGPLLRTEPAELLR
jgi:putative ABC transport system permease protein